VIYQIINAYGIVFLNYIIAYWFAFVHVCVRVCACVCVCMCVSVHTSIMEGSVLESLVTFPIMYDFDPMFIFIQTFLIIYIITYYTSIEL